MLRNIIGRRTVAVIAATGATVGGLALAAGVASASPPKAPKPPPPPRSLGLPPRLPDGRLISSLPSAVAPLPAPHNTPDDSQDGIINRGELVQWYFSNFTGSLYDNPHNDPNYLNNRFITAAAGQGATLNHDAESVWNTDLHTSVVVCTGAGYSGTCGTVGPNVSGNYVAPYYNGVSSAIWADSAN